MGRSGVGPSPPVPRSARRPPRPVTPRVKAWVCFGPRTKLGDGRARLLELIAELGSIQKAVARMGMSYRSAWGYVGELEAAAGFALLERRPGRGPRSGARLTRKGRRLLLRYRAFQQAVDRVAEEEFRRLFKPR